MRTPPGLHGTVFSQAQKGAARETGLPLFVSLMTDPVCNLRCRDCYIGRKRLHGDELKPAERMRVLEEARRLGAQTLRIAGEGEPLCDPSFWRVVEHALELGMQVFFFTNGTLIDESVAERIAGHPELSLAVKFAGPPGYMEVITGSRGYFKEDRFASHGGHRIPQGLWHLIQAGLNKVDDRMQSRLGIEFLLRRSNLEYAEELFQWCRENGVIPYFEQNLEAGNALNWHEYIQERLPDGSALDLSRRLSEIDRERFGYHWQPSLPYLVGGLCELEVDGCKKYTYNIVIDSRGTAHPCYAATFDLGNVRERPLRALLAHPIRRTLLDRADFNCLCRVYQRTSARREVKTVSDLDRRFDYSIEMK
ncbi:radical SAM protein [bacterium]|nr:radical SAM protein [candidate division CSSED10-310 bacterium]